MEDLEAQDNSNPYTILNYTAELLGIEPGQVKTLHDHCSDEEKAFIKNFLVNENLDFRPKIQAIINKYLNG